MKRSTYCDRCRREVDSARTEITRTLGYLVWAEFRTDRGYFCRDCVQTLFWKATGTSLTMGLLSPLSMLAAPFLTLSNLFPMLGSLKLRPPSPEAGRPGVDHETHAKVDSIQFAISQYMTRENDDLHEAAAKFAPEAGIRPAQVLESLRLRAEASQPPVGGPGFDVVQKD